MMGHKICYVWSERENDLTSHKQRGHIETGPRFKVSSERPGKRGIDLVIPGLVVLHVIHYTTATPCYVWSNMANYLSIITVTPLIWSQCLHSPVV